MSSPSEIARVFHARIQQVAGSLSVVKSTLNGRVSCHVFPENTSFKNMFAFHKIAREEKCDAMSHIGTINGDLCLTVNAAYEPKRETSSKKRKADFEQEEAERVVLKVKKSGDGADKVSEETYNTAIECISNLLKLKGASGEACLEAWAFSLRKAGQYGAAPSNDGKSSLVVAARVTGGVAIQLSSILSTFKSCHDGMITTSTESINKEFNLPMSEQCSESHRRGQRSILFLASVPDVQSEEIVKG